MNDRIVIPIWTLGLFVVVMNTTMFNVSIPGIISELGVTADKGSWIVSSYSIGYALSTIVYSRLSDIYPIRRLLTVGVLVLGLSSLYGLFVRDFQSLLAARILQSAGSGAIAGLGLVLASRYIPYERRGRAIAMISSGSALAFGLGPIVGGGISEYFGWNGLFAVTCLVLVVLPVLLALLPKESKPTGGRFDVTGAAFTVFHATSLLIAVTQLSWVWLFVCCLSFVAHGWHIRHRASETFINMTLFHNHGYRKLLLVGFCVLVMNMSNLFLMPLVLAHVDRQSELATGLFIAPGALLSAFMARFVGRWIDRYGNMRFLLLGHGLLSLVLACFAWSPSLPAIAILVGYLCFSPAFTAAIASLNNETSRILESRQIASGMGLMQLLQFFGGSVSVAICGYVIERSDGSVPLQPYHLAYQLVFGASLLSLAALLWYKLGGKGEQVR